MDQITNIYNLSSLPPLSYMSFHSKMVSEAQGFLALVQQELESYDSTLCKYFGVNRTPPKVFIVHWDLFMATYLGVCGPDLQGYKLTG